MSKLKFFTIEELCNSPIAKQYGIDNTPTPEIVSHLNELGPLLDHIRSNWGSPIRVTSGYRCPELNKKVGGAKNSSHLYGYAADIQPLRPSEFGAFCECVKRSVSGLHFDQIIIEKNSRNAQWIHIGVKRGDGQQRGMLFDLTSDRKSSDLHRPKSSKDTPKL